MTTEFAYQLFLLLVGVYLAYKGFRIIASRKYFEKYSKTVGDNPNEDVFLERFQRPAGGLIFGITLIAIAIYLFFK